MKNKGRKIIIALCVPLIFAVTLFAVSHLYYHRSVMATLSEFYMVAIDRDAIYEEGEEYEENLRLRSVENLLPCEKPDGVTMHVEYRCTKEHDMQVFYFNEEEFSVTLIVYIPGGGYTNNPLKYHWKIIDTLARETHNQVIMPIYLKVPNYTCEESYRAMREFYVDIATRPGVERIIFAGDSSGGGMALVMAQLMRDEQPGLLQPEELLLIAPWMDVSMENEQIHDYEPVDPMLDMYGATDLGKKWAGDRDVHDPLVSPIYGTFENLGRITLFVGTRDMLCPDILKFSEILDEQSIEHTLIVKEGLDHPYPLFPIPEADEAKQLMIDIINGVR